MRYLSLSEVVWLHHWIIDGSGGATGIRDLGALESAVAQPKSAFAGNDLYPSVPEKAAAIAYSLVLNHPFVDGNKRIGHAAMEVFLRLNGFRLEAGVDEQERLFLSLAAGSVKRDELTQWIVDHTRESA